MRRPADARAGGGAVPAAPAAPALTQRGGTLFLSFRSWLVLLFPGAGTACPGRGDGPTGAPPGGRAGRALRSANPPLHEMRVCFVLF